MAMNVFDYRDNQGHQRPDYAGSMVRDTCFESLSTKEGILLWEEDCKDSEADEDGGVLDMDVWEDEAGTDIRSSPDSLPRHLSVLQVYTSPLSTPESDLIDSHVSSMPYSTEDSTLSQAEDADVRILDDGEEEEAVPGGEEVSHGGSDDSRFCLPANRLHEPVTSSHYDRTNPSPNKPQKEAEGAHADDGDVLARLLARAKEMREAADPETLLAPTRNDVLPTQVRSSRRALRSISGSRAPDEESDHDGEEDCLILNDEEEEEDDILDFHDDEHADTLVGDRPAIAIAYLESLPVLLLSQIHSSLMLINQYEQDKFRPKAKAKAGRRKRARKEGARDEVLEADEESAGYILCADTEESEAPGVGRKVGGKEGKRWENVKVAMSVMNRKTGFNQVTTFPDDPLAIGDRDPSQNRIASIMQVASLLYEAILTNTVTTKRDIFYKDVDLFKTQATVDKIVDDLAASAGLKRQDFHVCATSKGLIASASLKVWLKNGEQLSFSASNASLIPPGERIDFVEAEHGIAWVLIVEKDAVFQTLCNPVLLDDSDLGPGVLVTGKGYPDLATLQILALIASTFPAARFLALVDADPHGIDILSVYTNGSRSSRFSSDHADLALGERLEWMGVRASEWSGLGIAYDDLLQLSDRDVQKAMAMLNTRPDMALSWRRELVQMLHLNRKAEIQILAMSRGVARGNEAAMHDGEELPWDVPGGRGNGLMNYVVERIKG